MTYVINEPCIGVKDVSCTEVCPVDCIHPTPDEPGFAEAQQLYIDPEECIDCDACVEACPVDAITAEDEVPPEWQHYIETNAAYYQEAAMTGPQPYTQPAAAVDDTGSGLAMFLIFTAAVLIVTGAVALLAFVGTWWMLGVTFAIDLSMTTTVVLTIVFVLDGRAQKIATRDRPSAAQDDRVEARPQTRIRPLTAP